MNIGLQEVSTASFVRRATPPLKRSVNALVVPPSEIEQIKEELRKELNDLSIRVSDVPLDRSLSSGPATKARGDQSEAVLVATTSKDENLWRAIDRRRSRLENGATMLFLLS